QCRREGGDRSQGAGGHEHFAARTVGEAPPRVAAEERSRRRCDDEGAKRIELPFVAASKGEHVGRGKRRREEQCAGGDKPWQLWVFAEETDLAASDGKGTGIAARGARRLPQG